MAEDVQIKSSELEQVQRAAKRLQASLDKSYEQCEALLKAANVDGWEGKSRDSFLTYLELIAQYHADLKVAAELQGKALDNLRGYKYDFLNSALVREVRDV
jgi:uncharacterized protein YoxC